MDRRPKPLPKLTPSDIARFWSHVDVGLPNACWEWKKGRSKRGYGKFTASGRTLAAHRVAFFLIHGFDPGDDLVCHSCDNPPCCNGMHLFPGTNADNTADCKNKGRLNTAAGESHGSRTKPESRARGERAGNVKLTAEDVAQIRSTYQTDGVTQQALADQFGVERGAIKYILSGRNWKHVDTGDLSLIREIGAGNKIKSGGDNGNASLSESDVRSIRDRYALGGCTHASLASEYGVSVATIAHVVQRRSWKHLP